MRCRPEIDGLRGIAVIPVVLFHAGFAGWAGGFVGVDVFFTVSGYLITSIIVADLEADRFSLWHFYERRARRILPALFLVMLCCMPFAVLWMLPDPLENFGQSVVATLFFSNNILLTLTSGYWSLAAEFKPLLHSWSLAIEEQFYLVYPILFLALWKLGVRWTAAALLAIGLASLLWAEWGARVDPLTNFYLIQGRLWELLAGALCSLVVHRRGRMRNGALGALGLALIAFAILRFDGGTPFPSVYTLVPVMGTCLVILFATEGTPVARALVFPPLVGVGLVSYSLYLWHQPVFAFARINSLAEPGPLTYVALITLSGGLSVLSWRYVERPFRAPGTITRRHFVRLALPTGAALATAGLLFHTTHGLPERFFAPGTFERFDLQAAYNQRIHAYEAERFPGNDRPNVLVLGNSYARDFANILLERFGADAMNLLYREDLYHCVSDLAASHPFLARADYAFLASGWVYADCIEKDLAFFEAQGAAAFVVGPKHFGYNLNVFARVPMEKRPAQRTVVPAPWRQRNDTLRALVPEGRYIDLIAAVSRDGRTLPVFNADGLPLTVDRRHLTRQGAQFFAERLFDGDRLETALAARAE